VEVVSGGSFALPGKVGQNPDSAVSVGGLRAGNMRLAVPMSREAVSQHFFSVFMAM
jgi:hypothetical protein